MKYLSVLLALAIVGQIVGKKDDHCKTIECPKYKVLMKTKDYELRHYPSYKWASAMQTGFDFMEAWKLNFWKLFRYISGANVGGQKIKMTAPVLNHITVTQGPFCEANFTMNFYIPSKFQKNPPQPNNAKDKVFITQMREVYVYVARYDGFSTLQDIQTHGANLLKALTKDGRSFDETQILSLGYDGPYRLKNRRNEVMVYKK